MKLYDHNRATTQERRAEVAGFLALMGYRVQIGRERLTKNGQYVYYIEYFDPKEVRSP